MTYMRFVPPTYTGVISVGPLIEYDCKMHGRAQISQYEILDLFAVINYTRGSRNKILDYTRVTHSMPCVQYTYKGKRIIIHMIIVTKRLCQITRHSRHLGSSDVLLDTVQCL